VDAQERRLVQDCLAGRTDAIERLVRTYQDRLVNAMYRITVCAEDAHDVVQECFLRALERLDTFAGESSLYTWLYRVAVNIALGQKRRRKPLLRLDDELRGGDEDVAEAVERSDPGRFLEQAEQADLVQRALAALAPEFRTVLVLKEIEDQSYQEIAEVLGCPIGTVRSRLHRARAEFRAKIEELTRSGVEFR